MPGARYLSDFLWINVSDPQDWENEARRRAERHGRYLCLPRLRRGQPFQYGLHEPVPGVPADRLPASLACAVADGIRARDFLGIFTLDGGWWVCAIRNGQLMLDGDRYFTAREDALDFFSETGRPYGWENGMVLDLSGDPAGSAERLETLVSSQKRAGCGEYIDLSVSGGF